MAVKFYPIQEGTGDPSPTNIRPLKAPLNITGIGEVWGGEFDTLTGVLSEEWAEEDLGGYSWSYITDGTYPYFRRNRSGADKTSSITTMCSIYKPIANMNYTTFRAANYDKQICITGQSATPMILVQDSAYTDADDFKTAMDGVQFAYKLATPVTHVLTPAQYAEVIQQLGIPSVSKELLMRRRNLATPHKAMASGAVVSFSTDMASPLKSCQFGIEPVQSGTGDPSPSNVRPISGWTGANISRTGVNIWNEELEAGILGSDGTVSSSTTRVTTGFIPIKPNTTYIVHIPAQQAGRGAFYGQDKTFLTGRYYSDFPTTAASAPDVFPKGAVYFTAEGGGVYFTFISPSDAYYLRYCVYPSYGTTYNNDISINYPSTDTAYHPYTGSQVSVEFSAFGKNKLDPTYSKWSLRQTTYAYINNVVPAGQLARMTFFDKDTSVDISDISIGWVYDNLAESTANSFKWVLNNGSMQGRTETNITTNGQTGLYCQNIFIYPYTQEAFNRLFARYNIMVEMGDTASPTFEPYAKVYGGHIDIAQDGSGVLVVDTAMLTPTWKGFLAGTYAVANYATLSLAANTAAYNATHGAISNMAKEMNAYWGEARKVNESYPSTYGFAISQNGGQMILYDADTTLTAETFAAKYADFRIVYPLATPIAYQLTPQQITALKGQNNVWSDTGNTTVKYWKH